MKCPKCDYLGFETGDRCKNCGYDFSLLAAPEVEPAELSLKSPERDEAPIGDLWLGHSTPTQGSEPQGALSSIESNRREVRIQFRLFRSRRENGGSVTKDKIAAAKKDEDSSMRPFLRNRVARHSA